jgi:hypothetical protein
MFKETRIRVECASCGAVRVTLSALTLRICEDNDRWSYCFRCPECGLATSHETWADAAVQLLVAIGATIERWRLPAELSESRVSAPVLTLDDLLDFHLLLEDGTWLASVLTQSEADAR